MKIGFVSLGCPKNLVDSEVMIGLSQQAGHELTPDPAEAEVLIVNTCAFIDSAKQESVDAILEMAEFKKTGACKRLVVTGCLGERYRDELRTQMPEIDAVLGTGEIPGIVDAIGSSDRTTTVIPLTLVSCEPRTSNPESRTANPCPERRSSFDRPVLSGGPSFDKLRMTGVDGLRTTGVEGLEPRALPTYLYDTSTPRTLTTPRHYAYLKVAEGCDYKCAFCIIPTLRGRYRSRPADSILTEARVLAERGAREIILISQDTTFYGLDRGERGALARLLRNLNRIDGIEWIRLLYLYPTTITDDTLAAMVECEKVCKYIDLPLQHSSDDVLRRMKRPGRRRTYDRLLAHIRARVQGVTLRTTFIVGYPGETDAEFAELCSFVRETAFDHVGVFTYSHEEGTSAYQLDDTVPASLKRTRRSRLMAIQKGIVTRVQKGWIGRRVRVLIDGTAPEHELVLRGRMEGQAPEIDSAVYLTDPDLGQHRSGTLVDATVVGARGYDLIARPLS